MNNRDEPIFELVVIETIRDFGNEIDDMPDEIFIEQLFYNANLMGINEISFKDWLRQTWEGAKQVQLGKKPWVVGSDTYLTDLGKGVFKYGVKPAVYAGRDISRTAYEGVKRRVEKAGESKIGKGLGLLKNRYLDYVRQAEAITNRPRATPSQIQQAATRVGAYVAKKASRKVPFSTA